MLLEEKLERSSLFRSVLKRIILAILKEFGIIPSGEAGGKPKVSEK